MQRKFLLISQVFYPDEVSTANLLTDLCSVLVKRGIEVEVWAGHPSYTTSHRQPRKTVYRGITIKYLPSSNFHKSSILGRIVNMTTFMIIAGLKILFSKQKTPIWTHTNPPFLGIILAFLCSFKQRKFIYILQDIYPEGLIRLGRFKRSNILISIWHKVFVKSLIISDVIVVIGRDMEKWVGSLNAKLISKISYIPNYQDHQLIHPIEFESSKIFSKFDLKDKFVIQYSGNMGLWNEIATIGKVVNRNIPDVVFIFVGGGIRMKELRDQFKAKSPSNTIFLPFQPNENFNDTIGASHVHIVSLKEDLKGIAVPCKIYGILACGRPVIAMVPADSEIAFTVREENCGIVIDPNDEEALIDAIQTLKSNYQLIRLFGANGRNAFEKKYTTYKVADMYISIIDQLTTQ